MTALPMFNPLCTRCDAALRDANYAHRRVAMLERENRLCRDRIMALEDEVSLAVKALSDVIEAKEREVLNLEALIARAAT